MSLIPSTNKPEPTTDTVALDPPTSNQNPKSVLPPAPSAANKRKRPYKRPFPSNAKTDGKRAKASFDKSEVAKHVTFTSVIRTAYELDTSFRGVIDLCSIFYNILQNRDSKIANLMTAYHLQYVTLLSIIYRCCLVAQTSTTTIIRNLSYLKETVDKLLLPDVICQYVETVGYYKMSTGITVIPYIRRYNVMKEQLDFVDPVAILAMMNLPDPETDWSINDDVILQYKSAISRVLKNAVQLRLVNNVELEAKPEFIACYEVLPDRRIVPSAFEQMNATQCTYGAVMKFRDVRTQTEWNGIKPPVVQETKAVDGNTFITDLILHHLKDGF